MKKLYITVLIAAIVSSCHMGGVDYPILINLENEQNSKEFSEITALIETSSPKQNNVEFSENNIVLMDFKSGMLLRFDREEKFLNVVAKRGVEEGDFFSYITHKIDEKNQVIYILDWCKILKFSIHGNYLGSLTVLNPKIPEDGVPDDLILTPDGNLLIHINNYLGWAKYDYTIIDTLGNEISHHLVKTNYDRITLPTKHQKLGIASYFYDNTLHVKDYGDTLFMIINNQFKPKYIFNSKLSLSGKEVLTDKDHDSALRYSNLFENKDFVIFKAIDQENCYAGKYNKKKKKAEIYKEAFADCSSVEDFADKLLQKIPDTTLSKIANNISGNPKLIIENVNSYIFRMIEIDNGIYIGETEVTHTLWKSVYGEYYPTYKRDQNEPVSYVSWFTAFAFTQKLSKITGKKYRLPTEEEWDKATGTNSRNLGWSGTEKEEELYLYANYNNKVQNRILPVKTKKPNQLGFYDLSGNVSEWCIDWSNSEPYKYKNHYLGPYIGTTKIAKGGSYSSKAELMTININNSVLPNMSNKTMGIRLALEL